MLELPDLEAPMRERFQAVVRDEVAAMTARLQALAGDVLTGLRTRWPMEDMLGADLVAAGCAAHRSPRLGAGECRRGRSDALAEGRQLLAAAGAAYLAGRLVDEHGVHSVRLRLQAAGTRAGLDLVWAGQAMSTETVMNWQMEAMRSGEDATPLTLRDVVERHGGEFWFERERVRHEAFFRFCCRARTPRVGTRPRRPRAGQSPEFYDFDLFQTSAQAREFDERALAELSYTVFDTETTGLNPSEGDEIIQIGALRIVNGRLLRQECFEQLVDPRRPLDAASAAIHGIRPEALAGSRRSSRSCRCSMPLPATRCWWRTTLPSTCASCSSRKQRAASASSSRCSTPCCCRPGCSRTRSRTAWRRSPSGWAWRSPAATRRSATPR
jgi:DNA polymerase-3 subunit epsilon